tara:strand:+ start:1883 stop:2914 length:1032 start_codon:yes stop_codon:yes gene_type:complete
MFYARNLPYCLAKHYNERRFDITITQRDKIIMRYRQQLADAASERNTTVTIGVFDGVHRGHCYLISELLALSPPDHDSAVVTFINHPASIINPDFKVSFLTSTSRKIQLLKDQGVKIVVPLDFSKSLSEVTARDFAQMLVDLLNMKGLVLGPDCAIGKNREGDAKLLEQLGHEMGFWVRTITPYTENGLTIRSRIIRQSISDGNIVHANSLLGRRFLLSGQVVHGDKRGRELGFPTANLSINEELLLPGDGIFAAWAHINGKRYMSATSIGIRPTFGLSERLVEAYILDFSGDLYGQNIDLKFVERIRGQEAFANIESLIHQVNADVTNTRAILTALEGADSD